MANKPPKPPEKPAVPSTPVKVDAVGLHTAPVPSPAPVSEQVGTIPDARVSGPAMVDAQNQMLAAMEEKRGPTAEQAQESLLAALVSRLSNHCGERGDSEGAVETLERIISERAELERVLRHEAKSDGKPEEAPLDTLKRRLALLEKFETKLGNDLRRWVEESPDNAAPFCWAPHDAERLMKKLREAEAQLQPAHNAFGPKANARGVLVSHVEGTGPSYDVGGRYRLANVTVKDGQVTLAEVADVIADHATHDLPFGHVRDHIEKALESFITPKAHQS